MLLAIAALGSGIAARASNAAPANAPAAALAPGDATASAPAPYEVATIHDTDYPIPTGALFVAPDGSDDNPGSFAAPFATIHKALTVAPARGTIVVRGGTYRESLGSFPRNVTIQAYPHEAPWVTGSQLISDFTPQGSAWAAPWTTPFCDTCYPAGALDKAHPAAGLPEQVFVDGAPLDQVTSRAALGAHSFFVDRAAQQLVLHDNPSGHSVEVTELASAFTIGAPGAGSAIRGVGFEHWGTDYNGTAAVMISGANVTLDNDTFAWSSSRAIGTYGANDAVTNSLILDNGMTGLNAHLSNNFDFEHDEVAYSNLEKWLITPSPLAQIGGVKVTHSVGSVFRANDFHDNDSNGLWFDQLSAKQMIVDNSIVDNGGHGLAIEVSGYSIVAGNVIAGNGRDGLKLSGANNVAVYNNTIVGNAWAQAGVYEDPRHTRGLATSDTRSVQLANNIFMAGPNATRSVLYSFDLDHPAHLTTMQMIKLDEHNVYGRTNAATPKFLVATQASATKKASYLTLAAYQNAMQREQASTSADGWALTRLFVDPAAGNYALAPGAVVAQPMKIPRNVAAALGSSTSPAHVGA